MTVGPMEYLTAWLAFITAIYSYLTHKIAGEEELMPHNVR